MFLKEFVAEGKLEIITKIASALRWRLFRIGWDLVERRKQRASGHLVGLGEIHEREDGRGNINEDAGGFA